MKFFLQFFFLCMFISSNSYAADLNKNINTVPTMGSEIKRGIKASESCDSPDISKYSRCIFKFSDESKQSMIEPEPYNLGLNFGAWVRNTIHLKVAIKNSNSNSKSADIKKLTEYSYLIFIKYQKMLKVSDEELLSLTTMNRNYVINLLNEWKKYDLQ